jgi:hypothetical protein
MFGKLETIVQTRPDCGALQNIHAYIGTLISAEASCPKFVFRLYGIDDKS